MPVATSNSPLLLQVQVLSRSLAAASALLVATTGTVVAADAPDFLSDPFHLALGTYIVNTDTELRLDGDSSIGTPIDWENTFGGGDLTRFRIDGHWRFADRHKARFMWFNTRRDESRRLDEDIEWGDETFPVDAKVDARFDFDIYELAYEYAFLRRDNYEVAGSIGLHYTSMSASLSAEASTSNGTLERDIREEGSVDLPLPVFGLRGTWGLPHDFWIDGTAQIFSMSYGDYDGTLQDYRLTLLWQPKTWLGIGLGYNVFRVDVDVEGNRFNGNLNWQYDGPMLSYSAMF